MFSEQGNELLLKAWNYVHIHKCVYTDTPMHALRGDFSSFLVLEYNLANTLQKLFSLRSNFSLQNTKSIMLLKGSKIYHPKYASLAY